MLGPDDGADGADGVPPPSSARVPLPLRRLPAESLRKLYRALEELEAAGLERLEDVGALRAAIADKGGLSKELLPPKAFTTEYAAMSLWAWTPSRWRAALAKHGAPSALAAPDEAAEAGGGRDEKVADSEGRPIPRSVARARVAMRRAGWLVDEDGNVRRVESPTEKEEAAPPEKPAPPEELADTTAADDDGGRQEDEEAELSLEERLEVAQEGLDCLSMACIVELRAFRRPPELGIKVVRMLGCLLGRSNEAADWEEVRQVLARPSDLMDTLRDFDPKTVSGCTWDSVEQMLSLPGMTAHQVKATNVASGCFFQWCRHMFAFSGRCLPRPRAREEEKEEEGKVAEVEEEAEDVEKAKRLTIWWRAMLEAGRELQDMVATASNFPTSKGDGLGVLFGDYSCLDGGVAKARPNTKGIGLDLAKVSLRPPKAASVVMVHIGGDGCGMGAVAWRRIQADHGLGATVDSDPLERPAELVGVDFGVHFSETRASKLVPRAVFVGSSDNLALAGGLGCAPVDLVDGSLSEDGVTFYHGFWSNARADAIMEGVRRQMEMCDFCPYLMMTHSGGDNGPDSGLACKVLESLKASQNKLLIWSLSCVASGEEASAASKANSALCIHHGLMDHTDFSSMVDKESLLRAASAKVNGLGLVSPSPGDLWQLTSGVVAAWTSPLSLGKWVAASEGARCLSPWSLTTNLVPYPRLHFGGPSYSPLVSAEMAQFDAGTNSLIVDHALAACRLSNGIAGKRLCGALLCRGIKHSEVLPRVREAMTMVHMETVDWSPIGFAVGSHDARSGHAGPPAEVVGLHSSTGFGKLFESWVPGFGDLSDSERSTYFEVGPFNQGCFDEARENVEALVQDYKDACRDTAEEEEQ